MGDIEVLGDQFISEKERKVPPGSAPDDWNPKSSREVIQSSFNVGFVAVVVIAVKILLIHCG